jgi:hypothetical protein
MKSTFLTTRFMIHEVATKRVKVSQCGAENFRFEYTASRRPFWRRQAIAECRAHNHLFAADVRNSMKPSVDEYQLVFSSMTRVDQAYCFSIMSAQSAISQPMLKTLVCYIVHNPIIQFVARQSTSVTADQ